MLFNTLRLASRARVALPLPLARPPSVPSTFSAQTPCPHKQLFCSSSRGPDKTKVCGSSGTDGNSGKKGRSGDFTSKSKGTDCCSSKGSGGSSKDCCSGTKGKASVEKDKSEQCSDSQKKFAKEAEEEVESCDEKESESESESSDEEKAPTKDCAEEEMSGESEGEEQKTKAASEMCDCVKGVVASATEKMKADKKQQSREEKAKATSGKPGPCNTVKPMEGTESKKPKNVQCCEIETSGPRPEGGKEKPKSAKEQCESKSKKKDKDKGDGEGKSTKGKDKKEKKRDPNLPMDCECIKKALNTCKAVGVQKPGENKPDIKPDKKSDKKPDMKPNKKPDKTPDRKPGKKPDQNPDKKREKKPGDMKPDPKKKDCTKKKPPGVICK